MPRRYWHTDRPDLVTDVQDALRTHQPHLHLVIPPDGRAEILGNFVVRGENGVEIDRYQISIRLLARFPKDLPVVRETGGRIPGTEDRHINGSDGTACVLYPEDRWQCYPENGDFSVYLNGPLRDFFLSQSYYEREGEWPFGEWGHGVNGTFEFYAELIGDSDPNTVVRHITALTYPKIKGKLSCPCGSGKFIRDCCIDKVNDLRRKIDPKLAKRSLNPIRKLLPARIRTPNQ